MNIVLNSLQKKYKETPVLNIDHLHFTTGAITGVLGHNGTGKTTLLRILAGLDDDYEGEILYDGDLFNQKISGQITMTFQKPMLLRGTVYKNIEYPLTLRRSPKSERVAIVEEMIEWFGLGHLARKNALTLSDGESQRVALARAFAFRPTVMLLDEPLSSVDFDSVEKVENIIKRYCREENTTIIMVTHSLSGADRICDFKVLLEKRKYGSEVCK